MRGQRPFIQKDWQSFFKVLSYHQGITKHSTQEYLHLIHGTSSHTKTETATRKDIRKSELTEQKEQKILSYTAFV